MNNYYLSIILKPKNQVEILLKKGSRLLNRAFWQDRQDLDKKLLPAIDKIFKKSNIGIKDIKTVNFSFAKDTSFIAQQIGRATSKSITFALGKNNI